MDSYAEKPWIRLVELVCGLFFVVDYIIKLYRWSLITIQDKDLQREYLCIPRDSLADPGNIFVHHKAIILLTDC